MRRSLTCLTALAFWVAPDASRANDLPLRGDLSIERRHTTNALDEPLAVPDWITLIRGTLQTEFAVGGATTTLALDGELRRHDLFAIEDDASIGFTAETKLRPTDRLEVNARLFLRGVEEGDALVVEDLAIGTTTRKTIGGASLAAGLALTPLLVLTGEAAVSRELAGDTRFEDELLPAARLEPGRDRIVLTSAVTRKADSLSYGLRGSRDMSRYRGLSAEGDIRLAVDTLAAEIGFQGSSGVSAALAAGVQWLHVSDDLASMIRPTLQAALVVPLGRVELRGGLSAGFDTDDIDDLLVAFVRRAEIEARLALRRELSLGAGVFVERKDNILLGYRDEGWGTFAELGWQAGKRLAVVLRLDYREDRAPLIGVEKDAFGAAIALRTSL